jgi:hypothetical protein
MKSSSQTNSRAANALVLISNGAAGRSRKPVFSRKLAAWGLFAVYALAKMSVNFWRACNGAAPRKLPFCPVFGKSAAYTTGTIGPD